MHQDASDFDNWLALLNEEQVEREIAELETEIEKRKLALDLKRRFHRGPTAAAPPVEPRAQRSDQGRVRRPRSTPKAGLTAAIRALLSEDPGREWSAMELRRALTDRGAVGGGEAQADRDVRSRLTKLFQQGELARPATGIYRLAQSTNDSGRPER